MGKKVETSPSLSSVESALDEQKEQIKTLENEKVELVAKLSNMNSLKKQLDVQEENHKKEIGEIKSSYETEIKSLKSTSSKNEKDVQNLIESIQKIKDENTKLKETITELQNKPVEEYQERAKYRYVPGDWVTIPGRYQKLRFQVRELLGEGVKGPLYRVYCYENDIAIGHIPESELHPSVTFRGI